MKAASVSFPPPLRLLALFRGLALVLSAASLAPAEEDPWVWHEQPAAWFGAELDQAEVARVTSLASAGPGSLREAIEGGEDGPRLVVFEAGGVIDLEGRGITIRRDHLWIAGQTAPSPGITVIRGGLGINASHVIVQHLRVRPGDKGREEGKKWEPDAIATLGASRDILVEHCSATWGIDENLSASSSGAGEGEASRRIVFRHNLIAHGLHDATHGKGPHSKGTLILDGTQEVALVGNLYAGNVERNPLFKFDTSGVAVNNIIACPGDRAIHASAPGESGEGGTPARLAVVGNVVLLGPDSKPSAAIFEGHAEAYFHDNAGVDAQGRPLPVLRRHFSARDTPPVWPEGLRARAPLQALWHAARFAGARPAERDAIDRHIAGLALSGNLPVIHSQEESGGYPETTAAASRELEVPGEHRDDWLEIFSREVEGRTVPRPTSRRPRDLTRFAAATVHPLATEAAIAAYDKGGNAVDAAIAAAITLGVVDGHNSGIGGGCFILIRAADGSLAAIDGRETAPAAAIREMFIRDGEAVPALSQTGALASGVPGALAAWEMALRRHGRLSLADLLLPAAELAERGSAIDEVFARKLAAAAGDLAAFPASAAIFLQPDGSPWPEGHVLAQADLAASYRAIAEQGSGWFYGGPYAEAVEAWMKEHGGILAAADFAAYRAKEREPLVTSYRGHDIVGFPPPSSGGVHVAQMLLMLEGHDLRAMDPAPRTHLLAEVMKLAFADRAHWLGDPDHVPVPRGLVDAAYATELAGKISLERASEVPGHGNPPRADIDIFGDFDLKHTQHLCTADSEGNWVAMTSTINTGFGSKVVIPGTGILLNNEMDDFAAQPGAPNAFGLVGAEANAVAPGKRPLSSMSPTLVLREGRVILALGAAGGPTIITQTLQNIVNRLDLGLDAEKSLAAPRVHHQWSPGALRVERSMDPGIIEALQALGHEVSEASGLGVSQAITWDPSRGLFRPAHDPRAPGGAGGR